MALSYSNSNIEACLVKQALEKTKEVEISDTASKTRFGLWHLINLCLHVVSITAVIWLFVQVLHLQHEVVRFNTDYSGQSGSVTDDQKINRTTIDDDGDRSRVRRQANPGSSDSLGSSSYGDYSITNGGLPSFHVTGNQQPEVDIGNWFTFHTSRDNAYYRYAHESLRFVHNKFFEVSMPGYYFVYSQMSYKVNGRGTIGHEVVVLADCGDGSALTILQAKATQRVFDQNQLALGNTGYAGGVFYLAANDRLGVRPLYAQTETSVYEDDLPQTSYFGAFLLAADSFLDVDLNLRRCL